MHHITITGDLGSGKSSVAKALTTILKYKYYSTGTIQRELALSKGMNTLELNYHAETNAGIDELIDNKLIELNASTKPYIFDSRMAWHFVKKSFKIYLTVNPITAAKRVMQDSFRANEPILFSIEEKANNLIERRTVEDRRFKQKYGVDCGELSNYDLVIDTSRVAIDDIVSLVIVQFINWLQDIPFEKHWVSPLSLIPKEHVRKLGHEESKEVNRSIKEEGYRNDSHVSVVEKDFLYHIWDGHKRTSGAIFNKISLIPVEIISKNNQVIHSGHSVSEFIESANDFSLIYDWEDIHDFRLDFYPANTDIR